MTQHGFHVERSSPFDPAERFVYAWCSCGWYEEIPFAVADDDRMKRAFLDHLRSLGTTARVDMP